MYAINILYACNVHPCIQLLYNGCFGFGKIYYIRKWFSHVDSVKNVVCFLLALCCLGNNMYHIGNRLSAAYSDQPKNQIKRE